MGEAAWWYDEYTYRHAVVPGLSHDEFLDEPGMAVRWLTSIHSVVERVRADKERQANEGG